MKSLWEILKATGRNWRADKCPKLAAALAYYSSFALAPLLVIAITLAGLIFGADAARGSVVAQIKDLVGAESAGMMEEVLLRLQEPKTGMFAAVIGGLALLFGASGVFGELQDSFNIIWKVKKKEGRGFLGTIKDRFLSLAMVFGLGFLLIISLVVSAGLTAFGGLVGASDGGALLKLASVVFSIAVLGGIFTLLFRFLPDAETSWRHVAIGGLVTAFLFTLGKGALGLYLAKSPIATTYGAAGAFVIVLFWVYYSSQILFMGAELTRTLAECQGPPPKPDADAVRVSPPGRS